MPRLATSLVLVTCGLLVSEARAQMKPTPEQLAFFESKVRPVLVESCYSCHSAKAEKVKGGLRLDTREAIRQGGDSGPALVPGDVKNSLLLKALRHEDESLRMPPKQKLPANVIADFEKWVAMGAPDPREASTSPAPAAVEIAKGRQFWSFRPLANVAPPVVRQTDWPRNDIDRFILAKLEERGLPPAADADRRALLRRVTYDLTGLPPTPEEIADFLADRSTHAYARVVDRLLASPAYGERWGRHWLDVVRYADTAGDNSDYPIPQMVRYRDWVIRATNRDLPYDQFVTEQLAGDLLPAADEADRRDKLIATGYLANARRFGSYEDARYPWYLTIEDTIDNLGKTFLGLTLNCCRCHDHKFDPLTSEDYYALYGFFQSTRYPWPGIELDKAPHDLVPLAPATEVEAQDRERRRKLDAFDVDIKRLEAEKKAADKALQEAERTSEEAERKRRVGEALKRVQQLVDRLKAVRRQREETARQPVPYETAYAVIDQPRSGKKKVGNACIQIKGDPERLGREVPRRFLTVLGGQMLPPTVKGSGRLELARWITGPANPLTARVLVNRLWHYHFGRGIVPTPSDFGRQGQPPTHPELLDFLARRFLDSGGSLKAMHRIILLSRTYQLSSVVEPTALRLDPDNTLLGRFPRRRLEAEAIRDTLLVVSGLLDRSPGGPHPFPPQTTWDFTQHKPFKAVYDSPRRSVYLMTQRIQRHPFLALFDGPDTNACTDRRVTSTTSLQALHLLNDPSVHACARQLAQRLQREEPTESRRVERGYLLLFGRPPSAEEQAAARDYLAAARARVGDAAAWESLARALFLSNELVYVD